MKDINNYLAEDFFYICLTSTKILFLNSYEGNKEIREMPGKNKIYYWHGKKEKTDEHFYSKVAEDKINLTGEIILQIREIMDFNTVRNLRTNK